MIGNDNHNKSRVQWFVSLIRWLDSEAGIDAIVIDNNKRVDWFRILPLISLHLACFAVIWVGWSPVAVITAIVLYLVRMFAITGFYHRYFSHRAFKANRFWQFVFGVLGNASVQRGPLWRLLITGTTIDLPTRSRMCTPLSGMASGGATSDG